MAEHERTEGPESFRTGPVEHGILGDNDDGNISWIDDLTADRAFQPLNLLLDDPKFRHGPYL
jgi:hypothetical protein